jgi:hypothetical protein
VREDGVPEEDQPTEADEFIRTLLEAEPKYDGRLIFVRMDKPKADARGEGWADTLKDQIQNALGDQEAVDALWAWDSLVKDACVRVSAGLTSLAQDLAPPPPELKERLKATMQRLASAPRHLATVLADLLIDQLEHDGGPSPLATHGQWLCSPAVGDAANVAERMNGLLLTAGPSVGAKPFMPGTVYCAADDAGFAAQFERLFGKPPENLLTACCAPATGPNFDQWKAQAKPVLVELSPACDVAQSVRLNALLVAGWIVPSTLKRSAKSSSESLAVLPSFLLRWPGNGFVSQNAFLVFSLRYKATLPASAVPDWLTPWFRLRELPTASLRNLHAGHASRVGYVSL